MRVGFAGTPEFAAASLRALHAANCQIPLVLTQPDRPAGRGLKPTPSPVKSYAVANGIAVAQPRSLKLDGKFPADAAAARAAIEEAGIELLVVAAYGLILPRWLLEGPRHGCINIHASLLPRWRGAAPIQRAIEAGDARTGITIMRMDAGLDTGDILLAESVAIAPDDTAATLHDKLAPIGARLIVEALEALSRGGLVATPQPSEGVTYARKIDKAEGAIDWTLPADAIERRVRAFDPFPGASFSFEGEPVKVWKAAPAPAWGAPPGTARVEGGRIAVACGTGALELLELQRPGGRRLPAAGFLRGRPRS